MRVWFDKESGIIRAGILRVWTMHTAVAHFDELRSVCALARAEAGEIRLLVDARRGGALAQETMMIFADFETCVGMGERDRLAVLTSSAAHHQQSSNVLRHAGARAFLPDQIAQAEGWVNS